MDQSFKHGTGEIWETSKCLRILRPLKLKIMALQRTLATSRSVLDGLTSWQHVSSLNLRAPSHGKRMEEDHDRTFGQPRSRIVKYGSRKRPTSAGFCETASSAEDLLSTLRSSMPPHIATAYLGVYYAYKGILDRINQHTAPLSLASRAAAAVGKCVVLTSDEVTATPIDQDDWYESTPAYLRTAIVLGQASQTLLTHAELLAPLLPALAVSTAPHPLACELLDGLLTMTSFTGCRKAELQTLQRLASQLGYPCLPQRHYAKRFAMSYFSSANLMLLAKPNVEEPLEGDLLALYQTVAHAGHDGCRKDQDGIAVEVITDVLEDLARRSIRHGSEAVLAHFADLYTSKHGRSTEVDAFFVLGMAHQLALLEYQASSQPLITELRDHFRFLSQSSQKTRHIATLVELFGQDQVVKLTELLVGRVDPLAVLLAYEAAHQHAGDFVTWANEVERSVMEAKAGKDAGRWRFEPLLDSWVASTPGVKKIRGLRMPLESIVATETSEESSEETDYEADTSQQQQQHSLVWNDANDDKDLISPFQPARIVLDQQGLSARRTQDLQASAKLLKRYNHRSFETCGMSPLIKQADRLRKRIADDSDQNDSPIPAFRKRQRLQVDDSLPVSSDCDEMVSSSMQPQRQTRSKPPAMQQTQDSPVKTREMRAPMRELNNLKSSFLNLRRKRKLHEPAPPRPPVARTLAKTPLRKHVIAYEPNSEAEESTQDGFSEDDELCLL